MYVIGLTGGIASGKSTVSTWLKEFGAYIIDADMIARDIVAPDKPAWLDIVSHFGPEIVLSNRSINRRLLGEKVFHDPAARKVLEEITHPRIAQQVKKKIESARNLGYDIVVLDVPLLIEAGWSMQTDIVWVVYVNRTAQLERLIARDVLTVEQAEARIRSQMSLEEKKRYANVVIDNSADLASTRRQVEQAWLQAKERCKRNL